MQGLAQSAAAICTAAGLEGGLQMRLLGCHNSGLRATSASGIEARAANAKQRAQARDGDFLMHVDDQLVHHFMA